VKKQYDIEARSRARKTRAPRGRLKAKETMRRVEVLDVCIRSMEVLQTRKPIAEIAHAAGFLTVTHFATFVKRRTGHSPRDLRR